MAEEWVTSKVAAHILGVSQSTIGEWARAEKLSYRETSLGRFFSRRELVEIARERAAEARRKTR